MPGPLGRVRTRGTRTAIVHSALKLAASIGLESVSLGVLANQLELSKSGLFAHFKSKEALQLAVMEEAAELEVPQTGPNEGRPVFSQLDGSGTETTATYLVAWG